MLGIEPGKGAFTKGWLEKFWKNHPTLMEEAYAMTKRGKRSKIQNTAKGSNVTKYSKSSKIAE